MAPPALTGPPVTSRRGEAGHDDAPCVDRGADMNATMAVEHSCSSAQFAHCPIHQPGRPKTKRCPNCGAGWATHDGLYAVVAWRGDGRYRLADALATYKRTEAAQRRAETEGESFVVRFLSA